MMIYVRIICIIFLSAIFLTIIWNYLLRPPRDVLETIHFHKQISSRVVKSHACYTGKVKTKSTTATMKSKSTTTTMKTKSTTVKVKTMLTTATVKTKLTTATVKTRSTTLTVSISPTTTSPNNFTTKARTKKSKLKYFRPTISAVQKERMLALLKVFKSQMENYNITYFLYAGSLIGAYRHHGMIPWDDDIDILVDSSQKDNLKVALQELNETHSLVYYEGEDTWKWKFFKLDGQPYEHKPFLYPYLDLYFFKDYNKTMFYVEVDNSWVLKRHIFPLIEREFEEIPLPTPCNTYRYLKYNYGSLDRCISPSWNHSTEYGIPYSQVKSIMCRALKPFFGFVERKMKVLNDKILVSESLRKGGKVIQAVNYFLPLFCTEVHSEFDSMLQVRKFML